MKRAPWPPETTLSPEEIKRLFPHASNDCLAENADDYRADSKLPDPKPKRNKAPALGSPAEGKAKSPGRIAVCFTGHRCKPLDPDNFAGGVKDLLDGLRHSSLIPEDDPETISLQTEQVKVKTRKEEKTIIRITYP